MGAVRGSALGGPTAQERSDWNDPPARSGPLRMLARSWGGRVAAARCRCDGGQGRAEDLTSPSSHDTPKRVRSVTNQPSAPERLSSRVPGALAKAANEDTYREGKDDNQERHAYGVL